MESEVVTTLLGILIGMLTGFYFERRATRAAELQNEKLRHELEILRRTVYSLGGDPDMPSTTAPAANLFSAVQERALATQDASGRVRRREVVAYFVGQGIKSADAEAAVTSLCAGGMFREESGWLHIQ